MSNKTSSYFIEQNMFNSNDLFEFNESHYSSFIR